MSVTLHRNGTPCAIDLAGEVDIRSAEELKQALVNALALGRGLCVDLTAAIGIDVTALQLLWAAEREARTNAQEFILKGLGSATIASSVTHSGLMFRVGAA